MTKTPWTPPTEMQAERAARSRASKARLAAAVSALMAACGGAEAPEASARSAVLGGRGDEVHLAIGEIGHDGTGWICSGTLIGRSTVLTAAHCLFDADGHRVTAPRLRFRTAGMVHRARRSYVLPGYAPGSAGPWEDAAMIRLRDEPDVEPIAIAGSLPIEGAAGEVVGFGATAALAPDAAWGSGERRRARITLDMVLPREIAYEVNGRGACYGDSGGPLLQDLGGGERVVGITSRGTALDCNGIDIATRADVIAPWIARVSARDACPDHRC